MLFRNLLVQGAGLVVSVLTCGFALSSCAVLDNKETVRVGYLPSWSEGLVAAYLLDQQFRTQGYDVEHEVFENLDSLYSAVARGEVDLYASAWPERTQQTYMQRYGDQVVSLGDYYHHAQLFFAVPSYSPRTSIEQLAQAPDSFGGKIVGIEPEAGLTTAAQDAIDAYGLAPNVELVTGSTAAMISQLQTAVSHQEDIVVTLWSPMWAVSALEVRSLEDPLETLGPVESLHFVGRNSFADDFPELAEWLNEVELSEDNYRELEQAVVFDSSTGEERDAVRGWVKDNPTALPAWD